MFKCLARIILQYLTEEMVICAPRTFALGVPGVTMPPGMMLPLLLPPPISACCCCCCCTLSAPPTGTAVPVVPPPRMTPDPAPALSETAVATLPPTAALLPPGVSDVADLKVDTSDCCCCWCKCCSECGECGECDDDADVVGVVEPLPLAPPPPMLPPPRLPPKLPDELWCSWCWWPPPCWPLCE